MIKKKKICKYCEHCGPFYDMNTVCSVNKPMRFKSVKETDTCDKFKEK